MGLESMGLARVLQASFGMSHRRISKCPDCDEEYVSREPVITSHPWRPVIIKRYDRCENCQEIKDMSVDGAEGER